ncbi:DNA polymerase III subunit delta' [Lactococcus kimchii]|uniref:DNA polymerase III subunit delta' n=1 Tax=Lactococcus sp. S-13 TaxID=2507158 RepID=UPI001022AA8B|nr:DNA polymerase III subunit delta' [Lactococcus sp. S-13]RZI49781.1 DNA polymerase III subunit delta' [Lactococcus sp. S-13]
MELAEIQPQLFKQFSKILQGEKLSHAYLFSGGFGSFELAIWLSQALFCQSPQNHLPCGHCRPCRLVAQQEFTDLHLVEPEGQMIKTAQIRELTQVFSESGYEGKQQVVLIRDAEKMHPNAANALLKSIEEPETQIVVFLLTNNENMILETIKSRTQVIHFAKNVSYLQGFLEQKGLLKTQAELLAQICHSPDEALEIGQQNWFNEGLQKLQHLVKLLQKSGDEAFLYLREVVELFDDKEKQSIAFELLLQLFNQEKMSPEILKTFQAIKMWKSNVRFESSLNFIVL